MDVSIAIGNGQEMDLFIINGSILVEQYLLSQNIPYYTITMQDLNIWIVVILVYYDKKEIYLIFILIWMDSILFKSVIKRNKHDDRGYTRNIFVFQVLKASYMEDM
eukprot:712_1